MNKKFDFGEFLLSVIKCGGYLAAYFAINVIVAAPLVLMNPNADLTALTEKYSLPLTLLANAVFILAAAIFYNTKSRYSSFQERVGIKPFNKKAVPYIICLGVCTIFAVNLIISLALTYLPVPQSWVEMLDQNSEMIVSATPFMQILTVAIIGPIAEEVLFRGLMLGSLYKRCNKWLAIIATSLIFGLVHGHPIGIIYASCLGILMGWLYCKTESLISVIIFHMVYNLFSVISPAMDDVTYVMVGAVGIIISAVCVASIAKLPKYTPKNKNDDNDKNDEV